MEGPKMRTHCRDIQVTKIMMNALSVVIPVYNEEEGIEKSVNGLKQILDSIHLEYEIIVIDDGSTDGTPQILEKMDNVSVLQNTSNLGYGASLKVGIERSRYGHVLITDGDATYPSNTVLHLIKELDTNEMVIGSRSLSRIEIPLSWKVLKCFIQAILGMIFRKRITDLNSGTRIFKKEMIRGFEKILSDRFSFTTSLTIAALKAGYRVKFVPISFQKRKGYSKVKPLSYTINFLAALFRAFSYQPSR